jgi:hypothetical protein
MLTLNHVHVIHTTIVTLYNMYKVYDPLWQVHGNNVTFEIQCGFGYIFIKQGIPLIMKRTWWASVANITGLHYFKLNNFDLLIYKLS